MKTPGSIVALGLMVLSMHASGIAQNKTFHEKNGLVVVECESVPAGDSWVLRSGSYVLKGTNTVAGYTGNGCYHFTGNTETSGSVKGTMAYLIHITNPGKYRLYLRGMEAPIESGAGDQANDCYIKMVGQSGCEGTFTKYVRLGNSYEWTFGIRLECSSHTFSDAIYELSAGTHTFQIAGRSKNFLIDRFVLINSAKSQENPTNLNLAESSSDGSGSPGDGETPAVSTVIIEPASGTSLVMGSTVTLKGSGTNPAWSYDADSDKLGEIAIGTGAEVSFSVPTGVTGPMQITLFLSGAAGKVQKTYSLVDDRQSTSLRMRQEALHAPVHIQSSLFGIDGRKVTPHAITYGSRLLIESRDGVTRLMVKTR
jgi:hypothetical protein